MTLTGVSMHTRLCGPFAVLMSFALLLIGTPQIAEAAPVAGGFVAQAPIRLLDTRANVGHSGLVAGNGAIIVPVAGMAGVPASGVAAVVMNVTVTETVSFGFVTVYPAGTAKPNASNLNYVSGQTVANQVVVKLGANGAVVFENSGDAPISLVADVAGYYLAGNSGAPGSFRALAPSRVLDTRSGHAAAGPVPANGEITVHIGGQAGIPATGVSAVVLNLTVTETRSYGFITAYPTGTAKPNASNLNYVAGQTVPNLAVVKVDAQGRINFANTGSSSVALIADVAGYFVGGTPSGEGAFRSLEPSRVLDTRMGVGAAGAVAPNGVITVQIAGRSGVPASGAAAVVLNLTATEARSFGFVTAYPAGSAKPNASNVNYVTGQTVPNLAVVKLDAQGRINLANTSAGSVALVADVAGYYIGTPGAGAFTEGFTIDPLSATGEVVAGWSVDWRTGVASVDCRGDRGSFVGISGGTHDCGASADSCRASLSSPRYPNVLFCVTNGLTRTITARRSYNIPKTAAYPDPWPMHLQTSDGSLWNVRFGGSWSGRSDEYTGSYFCHSGPCAGTGDFILDRVDTSGPRWSVLIGQLDYSDSAVRRVTVDKAWYLTNSSGG